MEMRMALIILPEREIGAGIDIANSMKDAGGYKRYCGEGECGKIAFPN